MPRAFSAAVILAMFLSACSPEAKGPPAAASLPPEPPRVSHFYVFPAVVEQGGEAQLCYGVSGVDKVSIEPGIPDTPAFLNRCVTVVPRRNTDYVLTASGHDGTKLVRKVSVVVEPKRAAAKAPPAAAPPPAGPWIGSFIASPTEVARGGQVNFCYETSGASSVRIEPSILDFRLPPRGCFGYVPATSATYTLTASDGSREVRKQVVVTVR